MSRDKFRLVVTMLGGIVSIVLLFHQSAHGQFLSRYSLKYFILLLVYHALYFFVILRYPEIKGKMAGIFSFIGKKCSGEKIEAHFATWIILILLFHVLGVFSLFAPRKVFSATPILDWDFAHHYHQVSTVVEGLSNSGKSWAYCPDFCAGYPAGTLFDVDMKFVELFCFFLHWMGINLGLAFNIAILLFLLPVPLILWFTARNFNYSKTTILLVVLLGTLIWHMDYHIATLNQVGMVSFVFASYWSLLIISVFYRYLTTDRMWPFFLFPITLIIGTLVHILVPVLIGIQLLMLVIYFFRTLKIRDYLYFGCVIGLTYLANVWWLSTLFRFLHYRVDTHLWPTSNFSDSFLFLQKYLSIESLTIFLSIGGILLVWKKADKAVSGMLVLSIPLFFILGNLGAEVPLIQITEPRRYMIVMSIYMVFGLSLLITHFMNREGTRGVSSERVLIYFVIFFVVLSFIFTGWVGTDHRSGFSGTYGQVVEWLNRNTSENCRIGIVDNAPSNDPPPAWFQIQTRKQFIGGPFFRMNLRHNYATITKTRFFNISYADLTESQFYRLCDLFNIKWIVSSNDQVSSLFESFPDSVAVVKVFQKPMPPPPKREKNLDTTDPFFKWPIPTGKIFIFKVLIDENFFIAGSGRIRADLNRIRVQNATAKETVIKYHWMESLRVAPALPIEKYAVEGNPIPFIKIKNGEVRNFSIFNSYRFE